MQAALVELAAVDELKQTLVCMAQQISLATLQRSTDVVLPPAQVIPSAVVLHLALADVQEATGDVAAAKAVYEALAAPLEVAEAREADKDSDASKQTPAEAAAQQVLRQVSFESPMRRSTTSSFVCSGSCARVLGFGLRELRTSVQGLDGSFKHHDQCSVRQIGDPNRRVLRSTGTAGEASNSPLGPPSSSCSLLEEQS